MRVIRIGRLTIEEAERDMARIWRTLEERAISSPQLLVRRSGGMVELDLGFLSHKDADFIARTILHLRA